MNFTKNLIFSLVLVNFSYTNASAMQSLIEESISHVFKNKAVYTVSKRFFSNKEFSKHVYIASDINKSRNKILETPIIPKEKPLSYTLPINFFMEKRGDVILNSINERIFHVHRDIKMEKELLINESKQDKQFSLFKKLEGKIVDRRIKVKDPLKPQYLPICYLHGSYKISDKDSLLYVGSGFRNSLNQVVTAGHNLLIDEEDVEKYFASKKILLPQKKFLFDKNFLTMQIIFGYRDEQGVPKYSHISEVNGKHCFVQDGRDLGVIQLPISQKALLDNTIGSLPTIFFPDQPHEYIDKNITLIGYPGEIKEPSLHSHSGPIKNVDPGKIVFYDVDTTKGNSGSPGLNGIDNGENITPAFLTHTHAVTGSQLNAGQGYDQDFYDFMYSYANEVFNQ